MINYKEDNNGIEHSRPHSHTDRLAESIDKLSAKIDSFLSYSTNSIPNKVVYLIFALIFGLIFGIEGVQFIFKTWLPQILIKG